jgi:hypothetical protein
MASGAEAVSEAALSGDVSLAAGTSLACIGLSAGGAEPPQATAPRVARVARIEL